jgi:CheY-like chemotaxis protein
VTDIAMPDDGLEMIREVKRFAEMNDLHIPTIAMTAYRDRRQELLAEGFAEPDVGGRWRLIVVEGEAR